MNSRSLEDRPVGLVGALPTCPREIPPGFGLKVALKRFRSTRSYTCSRTVSINLSGWSQQQITGNRPRSIDVCRTCRSKQSDLFFLRGVIESHLTANAWNHRTRKFHGDGSFTREPRFTDGEIVLYWWFVLLERDSIAVSVFVKKSELKCHYGCLVPT